MKWILKKLRLVYLSSEEKEVTRLCCEYMKRNIETRKDCLEEIEKRALMRINSTLIKLS